MLGLLARHSLSGYDLTRRMREQVGFFWEARHSQIYPELARLEGRGLVAHELVEQRERPDKKVYSILPAGEDALREWVCGPLRERPVRDELVLKAYSLWTVDPAAAAGLFREQERRHAEQLREYREIEEWMKQTAGEELANVNSRWFASYATLRRGIGYEIELVEWCRWLAGELEGSPAGGAPVDE